MRQTPADCVKQDMYATGDKVVLMMGEAVNGVSGVTEV